jgi:shikimate dehydrogenase
VPTAKPRAEVWGSPVEHSLSPDLHRAAYHALGLDWDYSRREVSSETLEENFANLDASFVGVSLTMPLKEAILGLVQDRDPLVDQLGAANTVWRDQAGWHLSNTDPWGVIGALREIKQKIRCAWILGAGATARSVGHALAESGCEKVVLLVRNPERAKFTLSVLESLGQDVTICLFDDWQKNETPDLVVSTLPGSSPFPLVGPVSELITNSALFDVSYSPWPSAAAVQWEQSSRPVVSGLLMLAHQAVVQVRLFHHHDLTTPLPREDQVLVAMKAAVGL